MGNVNGRPVDFTEEVNLSQFKLMRVVGRGAFGKVRIVERRDTKVLYALKYISKHECIKMDAVRNIFRERAMLEDLDHPFVCNLRFAFQDDDYMYMVMDLMMGGDMRFQISRKKFSEEVIAFWIAELACGIKYLHSKRVVHRDIKPDNILLDDKGHVHLTDFNIATHIQPNRLLTSHSGTQMYMAPEVFKGGGYNEDVDWWSLGVTFYECVYGKRPFEYDRSDDLKKAIVRGVIQYPALNHTVSQACVSAIQGFLQFDPSKRLGHGSDGWAMLIHHPFFRRIDWSLIETKTLTPPFQPSADRINFDATYDLEELLLEDQPLEAHASRRSRSKTRKRKPPKPGDKEQEKYEREMQLIEERFKMFDFTVFEKYEGFKDPLTMTVGEPPQWVKPAFEGAEAGDLLPVKRISTVTLADSDSDILSGLTDAPSTTNTSMVSQPVPMPPTPHTPPPYAMTFPSSGAPPGMPSISDTKRNSMGVYGHGRNASSTSLVAAGGERKRQSVGAEGRRKSGASFKERRDRDRKSVGANGMGWGSTSGVAIAGGIGGIAGMGFEDEGGFGKEEYGGVLL